LRLGSYLRSFLWFSDLTACPTGSPYGLQIRPHQDANAQDLLYIAGSLGQVKLAALLISA